MATDIAHKISTIAEQFLTDQPTYQDIEDVAGKILIFFPNMEKDAIINIITTERKIYQPLSTTMQDDEDGANWLTEFRATSGCPFKFWNDYKKTLTLPALAIQEIDRTTDIMLNKLANPNKEGNWYRAGLVVGHVQSGKTGNFIGLANKAMDVGYKIILVLTGMYNDLRSQTQMRIDKGAIGRITDLDDSNIKRPIGVGKYKGHPNVINLTSSKINGDFGSKKTDIGGVLSSQDPTILVCKKNSSILSSILRLFSQHAAIADDSYRIIANIPLFIIDDEADSASINTEYNKEDISKINSKIRAILSLFERRCYVGYTATPYANIFIDPDAPLFKQYIEEADGTKYRVCKEDLFPKNFIINLSASSNYIGPNVLFGIPSSVDEEEKPELPIIEYIKEGDYLEDNVKGKKKRKLKELPGSLVEAIKHFFVSTALRRARGQKTSHSSMLINTSQYIKKQNDLYKLVNILINDYCDKISVLGDNPQFEQELYNIYLNKISPSNKIICKEYPEWKQRIKLLPWSAIKAELPTVAAKVRYEVRVIHSTTDEDYDKNTKRLDYAYYENNDKEIDNGLYVIAIGGNTMARGITLEGLTVSYFFRTSNTFDTLMQMGRWFGYRDGYIDACRLYIERETAANFRNIAVATQRMRDDFDDMNYQGVKPKEYGMKVMRFPGVLEATARNKFGATVRGRLSLNRTTLQAYKLRKDPEILESNKKVMLEFLNSLGHSNKITRFGTQLNHYYWKCTGEQIIEFINKFKTATEQLVPGLVTAYIQRQINKGNLVNWTVVMASVNNKHKWALDTGTERLLVGASTRGNNADSNYYIANNAAVSGPNYESLDLTDEEYQRALELSIKKWEKDKENGKTNKSKPTSPYANCAKSVRKSSNGLLLLFNIDFSDAQNDVFTYVLSLPQIQDKDEEAISYEYRGNKNAFKLLDDEKE